MQRIAMHGIAEISDSQPSATHTAVASSRSSTLQIIATSLLISICYFTIGLQLAVMPRFVHLRPGYPPAFLFALVMVAVSAVLLIAM
jgi:hypothetical protein